MYLLKLFVAAIAACFVAGCAFFSPTEEASSAPPPEIIIEDIATTNDTVAVSPPAPSTNPPPVIMRTYASPNYDRRKLPVSMIVIHYTAAPFRESLNTLINGYGSNRVSAHYLVREDGTIYQLVDESLRAWHAGVSRWNNIVDVNSASIGIEIVNLGHDLLKRPRSYPAKQIEAVIRLCLDIQSRHDIRAVVGHSDVAPLRKIDPGELFPWQKLAKRGVHVNVKTVTPTTPIAPLP